MSEFQPAYVMFCKHQTVKNLFSMNESYPSMKFEAN